MTGTDPNDMIVGDTSDTGTTPDGTTIVNPDGTQTDNPLDTHPNNGSDPTEDPTSYLISPNPDIRLIKSISSVVDTTEDGII